MSMVLEAESLECKQHRDVIIEFRKILKATEMAATTELINSDAHLLRYIKAACFNLKDAEDFFIINLKRRDFYEFDTITRDYVRHDWIKEFEFLSFLGFDKGVSPILYVALGTADFIGMLNAMSTLDICFYCAYWIETALERQRNRLKELGKDFYENLTVILDFDAFSLHQISCKATVEAGVDLLDKFQDMHPGILKRTFAINVPSYFAVIFNIFKPILAMETFKKIVVCTRDSSASELLKHIDAHTLPEFLGGNKVDENGDPKCSHFIKLGCKVPEAAQRMNIHGLQLSDEGVLEISIPPGASQDISICVNHPGSKLRIEFRGQHTISFWIFFRDSNKSESKFISTTSNSTGKNRDDKLLKALKVHTYLRPLRNTLHCGRAGIYICRFDNTCSWTTSKQIIYKIQVLIPPPEVDVE